MKIPNPINHRNHPHSGKQENVSFQNYDTYRNLFLTGATLGPIVDSLHNQCLLIYDKAPIQIQGSNNIQQLLSSLSSSSSSLNNDPTTMDSISTSITTSQQDLPNSILFCSSWYVLPLLGIAYVVLGSVLPKLLQYMLSLSSSVLSPHLYHPNDTTNSHHDNNNRKHHTSFTTSSTTPTNESYLRKKAILAVTSTALIIQLSDYLQTHPTISSTIQSTMVQFTLSHPTILDHSPLISSTIPTLSDINLDIMIIAAFTQWFLLDQSISSFLLAFIVSIGGPLSEIPFILNGFWHYIPSASDYFPFQENWLLRQFSATPVFTSLWNDLALSKITGPCYFAVTMDAIQLGRWFDSIGANHNNNDNDSSKKEDI